MFPFPVLYVQSHIPHQSILSSILSVAVPLIYVHHLLSHIYVKREPGTALRLHFNGWLTVVQILPRTTPYAISEITLEGLYVRR
jgi:hypothetical protein